MTQNMDVDILKEWAEKRLEWKILPVVAGPSHPPPLRMLLLGTVGTGKTEARLMLESCDSVLTMAFTRVAAANLGVGCKTIDSVFHTNRADAVEDLTGELLVIDEISTCGAATLEVVSRRMQQVARVFWRRKFGSEPFSGALARYSWATSFNSRRDQLAARAPRHGEPGAASSGRAG